MASKTRLVRSAALLSAVLIASVAFTGCSRGSGVPAPSSDVDASSAPGRAELEPMVTKTVKCVSGTATIGDTGAVVKLEQNCDNVIVSGKGAVLLAENIGTLTVSNEGARVYAGEIAVVNAAGKGNSVTWVAGEPRIDDDGADNQFTAAG